MLTNGRIFDWNAPPNAHEILDDAGVLTIEGIEEGKVFWDSEFSACYITDPESAEYWQRKFVGQE